MKYDANESFLVEPHMRVAEILDGDSIVVENFFSKKQKEIRLYGLDAPENKYNRKLRIEEKKTRLPGELLVYLGNLSTQFILTLIQPGSNITLITETGNFYDYYKRQLAYVVLSDGSCLNEILIREGYAKPESEYYCKNLSVYQQLGWQAKLNAKGLYGVVDQF